MLEFSNFTRHSVEPNKFANINIFSFNFNHCNNIFLFFYQKLNSRWIIAILNGISSIRNLSQNIF